MKWIAPVGIILFIVAAFLLLRESEIARRAPEKAPPPVTRMPGIEWNSPGPAGASTTDGDDADSGPDVAGSVTDQNCRPQRGVVIEAVASGGRLLADCLTDEAGYFALGVPATPPFRVRVRGFEGPGVGIEIIPSLSVKLLVTTPPPQQETLHVKPVWEHDDDGETLLVQLLNDQAQVISADHRQLADSPWRFHDVPFGTYDVKVWNRSTCGLARRFEFDESNRQVEVRLAPPAKLTATPKPPARAMLIPTPPMGLPLPRELRQIDGHGGHVRGSFQDTNKLVDRIEFSDLPAGKYTLILISPGREAFRTTVEPTPGETLDLGLLRLEEATGSVGFYLNERDQETTMHGYLLTIYTPHGQVLEYQTAPGDSARVTIRGLSAGTWYYRAERRMEGGGLRSINHDLSFTVMKGKKTEVEVDLNWPF